MMSFFEKLRNSVGIEEEEETEDLFEEAADEEEKPKKKAKSAKKKEDGGKKIMVKTGREEPEEEEEMFEKLEEKKEEWFEPEGELAVDVYNTKESIVIRSTIAGVKPEDIEVSVENDVVTITGERKSEEIVEEKYYFYQECYWGSFSRQIILSEEVDSTKAEASMKDGIFTLRLPKLRRQQARKIKVTG